MGPQEDVLQFDPALRQQLLLRTGSTTGRTESESVASKELPVVARLDPADSEVPGLRVVSRFGAVVTGRVRVADVVAVRGHRAVRSLKLARTYAPSLAVSVPEVHARPEDLPQKNSGLSDARPLKGSGVVVAVLDWGLDFTHMNLRHPDGDGFDGDGSTRVLAMWDQRGGRTSSSPEPFGYGRLLTRSDIDAALRTSDPHKSLGYDHADIDPRGEGTHGTHVTDIAVGNGRAPGSSPGVAPGADLIFVHLRGEDTRPEDTLGDSSRLLEGFDWCLRFAAGRPLVVHMSLGRTGGSHDWTPLVVRAFDHVLATVPGVAVVMSCGNYFDSRMHSAVRVTPGSDTEVPWEVPESSVVGSEMEIWYPGTDRFRVTLSDPAGKRVADVQLGGEAVVRDHGRVIASVFHRRHEPNSGANVVDLFIQPATNAGTYAVHLHGEDVKDGRADAWIERTDPRSQARFTESVATSASTTGSICNGWLPLAVGAYDARNPGRPIMQFSSAGPTRDGRWKPDLSAPGGGVVAARSSVLAADGSRRRNGVVAKSGTSMAAPHVSGAIALVFEAVMPRLLPMALTRWVVLETARGGPPLNPRDGSRYGAGRLDAQGACILAGALTKLPVDKPTAPEAAPGLLLNAPVPITHEKGSTMALAQAKPENVLGWLRGRLNDDTDSHPEDGEAAVGQLVLRTGSSVPVSPRGPQAIETSLDSAVQVALARTTEHTIITASGGPPSYRVEAFGPPTSLPAPRVAEFNGNPDVQVMSINGGERVLLPANPSNPGLRRVDVPGLRSFYKLPSKDASRLRNLQADRLAAVVPGLTRTAARAMGIPLMRVTLATQGRAAFPVRKVQRGTPPADAGGVVNGITLPVLQVPIREPHCYLSVIAEVEGKLESINAWDAGAGVSLGPIQFNANRGALFRFLWLLWTEDRELFMSTLGTSLRWAMTMHGDHPDLLVARAGSIDTLHGRTADTAVNALYLETGVPGSRTRDPEYRRTVAGALRDCVVWPHVQDFVIDVSAWWLTPAIETIRAEGIGPLNPQHPDRDTFVLTALLLSAAVRFSACLAPLLAYLRQWSTVSEKLRHWEEAVRVAKNPCPGLLPRLRQQEGHARHVHDQLGRLLGDNASFIETPESNGLQLLDSSVAINKPIAPITSMGTLLDATASRSARAWNTSKHPASSGVSGHEIVSHIGSYVNLDSARSATEGAGINGGPAPFDAGGVEAIHQFQLASFVEASQVDGKAGPSTLDTLGLVNRTGMHPVANVNTVAHRKLTARDAAIRTVSGGEFAAATWWQGMVNPGWLGQRFSNGIHLVLARKLRHAEALLLALPAYSGKSGVRLGAALGINEGHKGARPTAATASMHTFGLAVDIGYVGNPWIIGQHIDGGATNPSPAGEVTREANRTMIRVLNCAARLVNGEIINMTSDYLSGLSSGTAGSAWDSLERQNIALRKYLALADDLPLALTLVKANRAVSGVAQAGESDDDAARRWVAVAKADLEALRQGPVMRKNAQGKDESVNRSNFAGRDPRLGFLSLQRDLVIALRDGAGLAWGAIDFGTKESGDMMHFDCRRSGVGAVLQRK